MFKYLWIVIIAILYVIFTIVGLYDLYAAVFEKNCGNCKNHWNETKCNDRTNLTCFEHKSWTDMFDDLLLNADIFKAWICFTGLILFFVSLFTFLTSLEG